MTRQSLTSLLLLLLIAALNVLSGCAHESAPVDSTTPTPRVIRGEQRLMGTHFEIQLVSDDVDRAAAAMDAAFTEVARVEALISEWRDDSEISAVNRDAATHPIPVGVELFEVVSTGVELSRASEGAFEMTFASCGHLWSMRERRIPSTDALRECLPRVGNQHVRLDPGSRSIAFDDPGVRIGVGGIGKGYGVDRAARVLEDWGFHDYVVNGGGDIRVRGQRLDRPWSVGIAHPRDRQALLGTLDIERGAVVSSGDYERGFVQDGVHYHHILDPNTGMPARASVAVTVIAPDATRADALSTALFVLGPERGLALAESMPGVEALIVAPDLELHMSSGFSNHLALKPN